LKVLKENKVLVGRRANRASKVCRVFKANKVLPVSMVRWVRRVPPGRRVRKVFPENKVLPGPMALTARRVPLGRRASKAPRVPKGQRVPRHCSGRIQTKANTAAAGRAPSGKSFSQLVVL
jgi:hypothetical protein